MKSYYTIKQGKDEQFYFNLKAANHEIILQSEGYHQKQGAINGIESVQTNCSDEAKYERRTSANGQFYFILKAGNGEIIGKSELYTSAQAMENGINSVSRNGVTSEIVDLTVHDDHEAKDYIIIVNGREKEWSEKLISFEEVVILAFGNYSDNPNTCYTVTYSRGAGSKPEGSMVKGQEVKVKSKMIFNVSATDKS